MNKQYFALKLIPSRPDFAQTMTEAEKAIMDQHVAYWKKYMDEGIAILFGPVLDPKGVYGFGIIAVDDEGQVADFVKNDPAGEFNSYEYYPMLAVVAS